jgi:hypothetical protein
MKATNLKESIPAFQNGAQRCLAKDGHVLPVFAYLHDGVINIAATTFGGTHDKDAFADRIVEAIREHDLREYVTVTEAWVLASADQKQADDQLKMYGSLKHAPGREEAVIIQHCTPTAETFYMAKISRDGATPTLESWQSHEREVPALGILDRGCRLMGLFARASGNN